MRDRERPTGKVRAIAVEPRSADNTVAVYATVICIDEAGKKWKFKAASFNFDLEPLETSEEGGSPNV